MARIQVLEEVPKKQITGEWKLYLQWCLYVYDDGTSENGYRFIYRRDDGSLQAARGQARIPSLKEAEELIAKAKELGWGFNEALTS